MTRLLKMTLLTGAALASAAASASTPSSYAAVDRASAAACITASGLRDAQVGDPIRFSDRVLIDARVVTGTYPQPHMMGAQATMLCAYNRRTKRAEVQEMPAVDQQASSAVSDVWWSATDLAGARPVAGSRVTMMLGSDGKITGKSGCNNYSINYALDSEALTVFGAPIGTRMMCSKAVMDQETRYLALLQRMATVSMDASGSLLTRSADGRTLRFTRSKTGA